MATTSPDNIWTPNSDDQYALVQDLGATATSIQSALVRRANLYRGTSTQRQAFTTAPEGTQWQDTNGGSLLWVRRGTSWVLSSPVIASGTVTANIRDTTLVNVNVTFRSRFTQPPRVIITPLSPAGATTTLNYRAFGITTTGCTIQVGRNPAASVELQWVAIQHE